MISAAVTLVCIRTARKYHFLASGILHMGMVGICIRLITSQDGSTFAFCPIILVC